MSLKVICDGWRKKEAGWTFVWVFFCCYWRLYKVGNKLAVIVVIIRMQTDKKVSFTPLPNPRSLFQISTAVSRIDSCEDQQNGTTNSHNKLER